GNPLYHWTHLELLRYFSIDKVLNEKTAPAIWEEANEKLAKKEMSVRSLLAGDKVEFIGTTDDPTDDLASHRKLHEESFAITVSPSFRPDVGLAIEEEGFISWLEKLGEVTDQAIEDYESFLTALDERIEYFAAHGCRSSDHGINVMYYEATTEAEVKKIFQKRLNDEEITPKEIDQFKTYTLTHLGRRYAEKGWAMQLHLNPL